MPPYPPEWRRVALLCLAAPLAGCGGVLDPQGPVGHAQSLILFNALAIMLAIVIPTILGTLAFAWWFRAGNARAQRLPKFAYSGRIELVTWSIPILVVLFLAGLTWTGSHQLDPARPLASDAPPLEVQVVSLDWKWLFIYPEQKIATVNELVIPTGRPVHFTLTSASVMNAFFIPQLGSMIYTMGGMATELNLQADAEGKFRGQSSHFSGDGFPGMHFTADARAPARFDEWVRGAQQSQQALDRRAYAGLVRQSTNVPPASMRLADSDLFHAIVGMQVPPGPGPRTDTPRRAISPKQED